MRRGLFWGLVFGLSCAALKPIHFGAEPTTTLPAGLSWCGDGPASLTEPFSPVGQLHVTLPETAFRACQRALLDDGRVEFDSASAAEYRFRFRRGADGRASSLCVVSGNFGNTDDYLRCIADVLMKDRPQMGTDEASYRYIFRYD